jgi:hypothetical protein
MEALLITSDEVGLEANSENTEYVFISPEQNWSGGDHNINTDSMSFENVADLKLLGMTLTNIQSKIICSSII